ncbi:MAG: hypothetical protein WA948_12990 [Pontixanthobacter sp.]
MSDMSFAVAGTPFGTTGANYEAREADRRIAKRWAAIDDAAQAVRIMADAPKPDHCVKHRDFRDLIRNVDEDRRKILVHGIDDLIAIMQPGLAALLTTVARGQDATVAAKSLTHELDRMRGALLTLLPDPEHAGSKRAG